MRLFFSLCFLLFSSKLPARDIILVTFDEYKEKGRSIEKILNEKFHIPKTLITLKETTDPCKADRSSVIHLCLTGKGNMKVAHRQTKTVTKAFGIFFKE